MKFTTEIEVDVTVEAGDPALVTGEHAQRIVRSVLERGQPFAFLLEDGLILRADLRAVSIRKEVTG